MCVNIKRKEKDPLTSIKNQNWIRKKFGESGIRVYLAIKNENSFQNIISQTNISKEQLLEILQLMQKKDMIEIDGKLDLPKDQPEPVADKEEVEQIKKEIKEELIKPTPSKQEKKVEEIEPIEKPPPKKEIKRGPPVYPPEEKEEKLKEKEIKQDIEEPKKEIEEKVKPKEPPKPEPRKKEKTSMTPVERLIFDKFGESGVAVYRLIDGKRTAEEILKQTGVSEIRLIEILEFLDKQGIIKLDKPSKEKHLQKLSPLTEMDAEAIGVCEEKEDEAGVLPIDIPVKSKLGFTQKLKLGPEISLKFGGSGSKIFDLIDGNKNIIDLAVETKTKLEEMDKIMEFLGLKEAALFKSMDREEIRYKYGEEGFAIYKRYGREGIYVYELIGRVPSFKDIVQITGIEPQKVVEIFIFIHNVLDIELPLTKQMMYRQLGIAE